jgi:hypothetical protein
MAYAAPALATHGVSCSRPEAEGSKVYDHRSGQRLACALAPSDSALAAPRSLGGLIPPVGTRNSIAVAQRDQVGKAEVDTYGIRRGARDVTSSPYYAQSRVSAFHCPLKGGSPMQSSATAHPPQSGRLIDLLRIVVPFGTPSPGRARPIGFGQNRVSDVRRWLESRGGPGRRRQ